jgi:hypothetical protein
VGCDVVQQEAQLYAEAMSCPAKLPKDSANLLINQDAAYRTELMKKCDESVRLHQLDP